MQKTLLLAATGLLMACTAVYADNLELPSASVDVQAAVPAVINLPRRGQEMRLVLQEYGEPQVKHPAVGGGQPRHPPITRWDYAGFSVFFENSHVVDAVVPDQPAEIHNKAELQATQ